MQKKKDHIHFVGIGGSGMSGIAKILFNQGYKVSGSDIKSNFITKELILLGIKIYFFHHKENIKNSNILVVSTAIPLNNPEILAAKKNKIPIFKRAEILSEIMRPYHSIAISGTHGKTTTTGILTSIYLENKIKPTFISGSVIKQLGISADLGSSKYFITEADESDRSFLFFNPIKIIITNIEKDHLNNYNNNFQNLKKAFIDFLKKLPFYGVAIVCIDNLGIKDIINKTNKKIITYGFNKNADFKIVKYKQYKKKGYFQIFHKNKIILKIELNIPGIHNALNATAAIVAAISEKISKKNICNALKNFQGSKRRFEILGEFYLEKNKKNSVILIDDYGHHPNEIKANIKTIKTEWYNKNLLMIFQPHRYTRLYNLYKEFLMVLNSVDTLLLLDIYSAGENPIIGFNIQNLINALNKEKCFFIKKKHLLKKTLSFITGNDVILIQGAGDIDEISKPLFKKLNNLHF